MNSSESAKLLAASGGDTVKLFDISLEPQSPCVLTYSPSPSFRVNSVKWNHNNLVVASAGDDGKISLRRQNGQSLWTVPAKNAIVEPLESVSAISFSNKGSRYLCSGGTGQVVRIWDLQNKRCVKWLKGHTDTITGVMYNCKDEHIASVSRKGDLILHNLSSGTKAAELRDPNGQVLGALDYSRLSRHLLVTAGDDGSIHLWDTTGRNPKISWLKQHSAPTSGISFSPSNDKIIASVGLDMKLYTFDSGLRKPSFCISYEAPFSSLAFSDDGLTLAAGTNTGQVVFYDVRGKPRPVNVLQAFGNSEAVTNICYQRSNAVTIRINDFTDETVLLAGDAGDSILTPDPLPSRTLSGSLNPGRSSSSGDQSGTTLNALSSSEQTPIPGSLLPGGTRLRLNTTRAYNFKDDMEVFSPLVEVQPMTPSLDKLWNNREGSKKDLDGKSSLMFSFSRFGVSEEGGDGNHSIFGWKSNSMSKKDDIHVSTHNDENSSITPRDSERLSERFNLHRPSIHTPSRFSTLTSSSSEFSEAVSSPLSTKKVTDLSFPKRFPSYGDRIGFELPFSDSSGFSVGSPKTKKTGAETREESVKTPPATVTDVLTTTNSGDTELQSDSQPGTSFSLQLFQRTLEETLESYQESVHEDVINLHIEVLRQFHMQEMKTSNVMNLILKNQAEIMKELRSLRNETEELRQLL